MAVGAGLRFRDFASIELSQFDEGIYAISSLWPWTGRFEPNQGYYSPPLYPLLSGVVNWFMFGPNDRAGVMVSGLFSLLTIPLAARFAKEWSDARAGVVAAWLVALDGMQIEFARATLTDATFGLFFMASLLLAVRAIQSGAMWNQLLAGAAIGSTWNIKYNGFLPLFLVIPLVIGSEWKAKVLRLAMTAVIALFLYQPWAITFHVEHGYGSLIEHHRGYVAGWNSIVPNWSRAVEMYSVLQAPVGLAGALAATAIARKRWTAILLAAALVISGSTRCCALVLLALAGVGIASCRQPRLAAWMAVVLVVLPACYQSYIRLWLPTELLLVILAAIGVIGWLDRLERLSSRLAIVESGGLMLAAIVLSTTSTGRLPNLRGTIAGPGYRETASRLAANRERYANARALIRPPLFYYLFVENELQVRRLAGDIGSLENFKDGLLIVDPALRDAPAFRSMLEEHPEKWRLVETIEFQPSLITRLDDRTEANLSIPYQVKVYAAKP